MESGSPRDRDATALIRRVKRQSSRSRTYYAGANCVPYCIPVKLCGVLSLSLVWACIQSKLQVALHLPSPCTNLCPPSPVEPMPPSAPCCAHDHDCEAADCGPAYSLFKHIDLAKVCVRRGGGLLHPCRVTPHTMMPLCDLLRPLCRAGPLLTGGAAAPSLMY